MEYNNAVGVNFPRPCMNHNKNDNYRLIIKAFCHRFYKELGYESGEGLLLDLLADYFGEDSEVNSKDVDVVVSEHVLER